MSLTFANLINEWNHAAGSEESSAGVSAVEGINQALTHLSYLHQWEGMVRSAIPLATVAGQSYVDLPADCLEVISIQFPSSYLQAVKIIGQAGLQVARTVNQHPASYSSTYFGAYSYRVGATGSVPVLDTYPDQASTAADTFRITYRARLVLIGTGSDTDTGYINIPPYLEALARRVVRIFAKAIEEEDDGSLEARLEGLAQSSFMYQAKAADGYLSPVTGPLADASTGVSSADDSWTDISLADPT